MWNQPPKQTKTKEQNKNKLIDAENRLIVAGSGWGVGEFGEDSQRYKLPVIR